MRGLAVFVDAWLVVG